LAYYQQATANLDDPIANDAIERITLLTSNKEDSLWLCVLAQAEREFYQRKFELGFRLVDSLAAMPSDIAEQALLHAASIALDQGIDSTSSRYWNMLLTQYPETLYGDRILWGLAIIAQRSGNTEEALSLYNQLLARYPNSILVPQTRSQIRMLRGQM
jgi:tetratricopeptide (TPR) repeat protein